MLINIELSCPHCHSQNITRNGKKSKSKQNFIGKDCGRPFISDLERTYNGTYSWVKNLIKIMLVRGIGIRDISVVLCVSITTVLKVLKSGKYKIQPKQRHYDHLGIDEFWTYVGKKQNKVWLIYAYHPGRAH
jgi:transposase-like protein